MQQVELEVVGEEGLPYMQQVELEVVGEGDAKVSFYISIP